MGFFWACDCDQMKFWSEQTEEFSRRAQYRRVEEEQRDSEIAIEGEPLFLGSTATTFLQQFLTEQECLWKNIRQMLVWDKRTKVRFHRKHDKFRCHQTDTLKRMYVTRGFGKKYSSPSQSLGHMQGQDARRIGRRVEMEESILPQNKQVLMQGNGSNPLHQVTNALSQRHGIARQKNLANG